MHIHFDSKLRFALLSFAAAFAAVMFLFIKKPHIVRSRNKYIRTFFVFAIAFIPGVLAASIRAKTITTVFDGTSSEGSVVAEAQEREVEEEEKEEEDEYRDIAG